MAAAGRIATSTVTIFDDRFTSIVLKNSEIEPPRKSRFRERCVISADSPHGRACRRGVRGKTGRSAEPLSNFSSGRQRSSESCSMRKFEFFNIG